MLAAKSANDAIQVSPGSARPAGTAWLSSNNPAAMTAATTK
jgi:hypothetical protein